MIYWLLDYTMNMENLLPLYFIMHLPKSYSSLSNKNNWDGGSYTMDMCPHLG